MTTYNEGTHDISALIAAKKSTMKDIGYDTVRQILQADLDAHNQIVREMLGDMCEFSSDALRWIGASSTNDAWEVDEYGRAPAQITPDGYECGFPLRMFQVRADMTRKFLETATVDEIAKKQLDAETAHRKSIERQIKKAIFGKTNYSYRDHLVDNVSLPVKRFLNGDGAAVAHGPNGETFTGASIQHYQSTGTATVADFQSLVENVVEHGHGDRVCLYINRDFEATMKAYSGFDDLIPVYLTNIAASSGVPERRLDETRLDNRQIGYLRGAEVWTKPWIPSGYHFCFSAGDARKPLLFRQRSAESLQGLRLAAEFDTHPLQAQLWEWEFGVGVWTRSNGAVLYTGNDTWADATIS